MIRTAIFGTNKKCESIISLLKEREDCIISGTYTNINSTKSELPAKNYSLSFSNPDYLIDSSDVLIFADQVYFNFESIRKSLKKSKHVFIFPDSRIAFFQLVELNKLAEEAGVLFHIRNNTLIPELGVFLSKKDNGPDFINIHRSLNREKTLAGRSIFDSLYDEIIFAFTLSGYNLRKSGASTVPWCSPGPSLAEVRLEFDNGSTANIVVNNFALKDERHTEIYSGDKLIIMDSGKNEIRVIQKNPHETNTYSINISCEKENNSGTELYSFLDLLSFGNIPTHSFQSDIQSHLSTTMIIHDIFPYPIEELALRG